MIRRSTSRLHARFIEVEVICVDGRLCLCQAFLEMDNHEEALDMVNYYQQHPASLYGKPITFYLSQRLLVIEVPTADWLKKPNRLAGRPANSDSVLCV